MLEKNDCDQSLFMASARSLPGSVIFCPSDKPEAADTSSPSKYLEPLTVMPPISYCLGLLMEKGVSCPCPPGRLTGVVSAATAGAPAFAVITPAAHRKKEINNKYLGYKFIRK